MLYKWRLAVASYLRCRHKNKPLFQVMQFYLRLDTSTYILHIYDSVSILRALHFTNDLQQRPILLPRRRWQNISKTGGHQRRNWRGAGLDQVERERAASHLGDIRSVVCEQSRPAGEQSRSLELRYYRLVGPSVWKCTCRRAGLRLRRDTGGGSGFSGCLSAVNVSAFHSQYLLTHIHSSCMFLLTSNTRACLLHVFFSHLLPRLPLVLPICCFRFPLLLRPPSIRSVRLSSCPYVVLHSTPPSFKCWWAAEQYPGGHGDRQPPPCSLFLLLSYCCLASALY